MIAVQCPDPPKPAFGDYQSTITSQNFKFGDVITYTCNQNYDIVGESATVNCSSRGTWDPVPPTCQCKIG